MADIPLERLYARFSRSGDLDALAEVFDRVAPDLERLARRLTVDSNQAADLVQATFLTAMESSRTFQDDRALRPWLLGILVHRASAERKLARRVIEQDRLDQREVEEPIATLGAREFRAAVSRAIEELPANLQSVVRGRVLEERGALELAEELAISQGALRVRLHRGLQRLRQVLPTGLATGFALLFLHSKGLARARTELLHQAAVQTKSFPTHLGLSATGTGTMMLSKKITGVAAGLAITFLSGWLYTSLSPKTDGITGSLTGLRAPTARSVSAPVESVAVTNDAREPVAPLAVEPTPEPGTVIVRATLESGAEAAGFPIELWTQADGPRSWTRQLADDQGLATFTVPALTMVYQARVPATPTTAPQRKWISKRCRPGGEIQVEVRIVDGWPLSGRVVDREGNPVPGAEVQGWSDENMGGSRDEGIVGEPDRVGTADSDGRFRLEHIGPSFVATASAAGMACYQGLRGELSDRVRGEDLTIVLTPERRIHGVVLSPDQQPLSGAEVWVANGLNSSNESQVTAVPRVTTFLGSQGRTISDEQGRYEIQHLSRAQCTVNVRLAPYLVGREARPTGDAPQDIVLDSGASLRGRVMAADGKPAKGALVRFWPFYSNVQTVPGDTRTDERGEFHLRGMLEQEEGEVQTAVAVLFEGHALHVIQPVRLTQDGGEFLELRLDPERVIAGTVVDPGGVPVSGVKVRIEGDRELDLATRFAGRRSTWEFCNDLDEQVTDEQGAFRFEKLYGGEFTVHAHFPNGGPTTIDLRTRSGAQDLRLVLDPEAARKVVLRGTVRDVLSNGPIQGFSVSCTYPGFLTRTQSFQSPEGVFEHSGLEPGRFAVTIRADGYAARTLPEAAYDLGEHKLDVALAPARSLSLRVVDEAGAPYAKGLVEAIDTHDQVIMSATGSSTSISARTINDGLVTLHGLPAERLTLRIRVGPRIASNVHDIVVDLSMPLEDPFEVVIPGAPVAARDVSLTCYLLVALNDEEEQALSGVHQLALAGDHQGIVDLLNQHPQPHPDRLVELKVRDSGQLLGKATVEPTSTGGFAVKTEQGTASWGGVSYSSESSYELPQPQVRFDSLPRGRILIEARAPGYRPLDLEIDGSAGLPPGLPRFLILRASAE